jgi:hypothetical protein
MRDRCKQSAKSVNEIWGKLQKNTPESRSVVSSWNWCIDAPERASNNSEAKVSEAGSVARWFQSGSWSRGDGLHGPASATCGNGKRSKTSPSHRRRHESWPIGLNQDHMAEARGQPGLGRSALPGERGTTSRLGGRSRKPLVRHLAARPKSLDLKLTGNAFPPGMGTCGAREKGRGQREGAHMARHAAARGKCLRGRLAVRARHALGKGGIRREARGGHGEREGQSQKAPSRSGCRGEREMPAQEIGRGSQGFCGERGNLARGERGRGAVAGSPTWFGVPQRNGWNHGGTA